MKNEKTKQKCCNFAVVKFYMSLQLKRIKTMYRTIFTPTVFDSAIPFTVPSEWYGREIEFIAFPVEHTFEESKKNEKAGIMKYFGAWKTDKSAEEIIADIRSSRTSGKTRILADF